MTELKQKSGYSFVYEGTDINTTKKVNVNATTLRQAVDQILEGQQVSYEIKDKNIIVSQKKNKGYHPYFHTGKKHCGHRDR